MIIIKIIGTAAGAALGGIRRARIIQTSPDQFISSRKKVALIARDSSIGGAVGLGLTTAGEALYSARTRLTKLHDTPPIHWDQSLYTNGTRGVKLSEDGITHSFVLFDDRGRQFRDRGRRYELQITDKIADNVQTHLVYRWQLPKSLRAFLKLQEQPV